MNQTLEQIIERWNSGEGKPYKGKLIDFDAYEAGTDNIGCMCAQGQVLHLLGGWEPERLRQTEQVKADEATAKLLNISVAHAILLRDTNDSVDGAPAIVLTNPEKVLGDQAHIVLAFWLYMDRMTADQWDAARGAARDGARGAAWGAARDGACGAAWGAAWGAARGAARGAAGYACGEIQGARVLREQGKPFFFLPMFGFDGPEAIPALPADYGKVAA